MKTITDDLFSIEVEMMRSKTAPITVHLGVLESFREKDHLLQVRSSMMKSPVFDPRASVSRDSPPG